MEIWDHTRLQAEGRFKGLDADMQQPTACREDKGNRVRSVVPKLIANGESHALERGSPQLGVSGLGSHVRRSARGRRGGRRTFVGARLRKGHAEKTIDVRETKGGAGARACVLPEMHKCPGGLRGRKHLPGSGLDLFRVRRRCGVRVQRSHRRTLSTESDGKRGGGTVRFSSCEKSRRSR